VEELDGQMSGKIWMISHFYNKITYTLKKYGVKHIENIKVESEISAVPQ
jgi:hypothetical protein